uniref:Uncharacterized protein n=1 Tax=Arundo donax TaxID=35708 RepID=A0A0A8Z717_ARUDO
MSPASVTWPSTSERTATGRASRGSPTYDIRRVGGRRRIGGG